MTLSISRTPLYLRALPSLLVFCLLAFGRPAAAQGSFDPADGPRDLSVQAYEAAKETALARAKDQAAKKFADKRTFIDAIKEVPEKGKDVRFTLGINGQVVEGRLYGIDKNRGTVEVGDRKVLIDDLIEADQIRVKYVDMTPAQVKRDIAERERLLDAEIDTYLAIRVDQLLARDYTKAFFDNTVVMSGRYYYIMDLAQVWAPISVRRMDARPGAEEAKEQADAAGKLYVPLDPTGKYIDILVRQNRLKVDGQLVISLGDQPVATSWRGEGDAALDTASKWSNLRATIRLSDLGLDDNPRRLDPKELGKALQEKLSFHVYLANTGHWEYKILPYRTQRGDEVSVGLVLDRKSVVDAKGKNAEMEKSFVAAVEAAEAYTAKLEEEREAVAEEWRQRKLKDIEIQDEIDDEAERKRKIEAEKRRIQVEVSQRIRERWFYQQKPPEPLIRDQSVNFPVGWNFVGDRDLPSAINGNRVIAVSAWGTPIPDSKNLSEPQQYRVVGSWYRFVQVMAPNLDGDPEPVYYLQSATYYHNQRANDVMVSPRLVFQLRESKDEIIKQLDRSQELSLRHQYRINPNWSGWLIGMEPISVFQVYRQVQSANFELDPKDEFRPPILPSDAPVETDEGTEMEAPADGDAAAMAEDGAGEAG